ncbi:MAG: hypothetical protein ACJA0X_003007 [Cyclobacteriaceae bacterium]
MENSVEDMSSQKPISQIFGGRTRKLMRNLRKKPTLPENLPAVALEILLHKIHLMGFFIELAV